MEYIFEHNCTLETMIYSIMYDFYRVCRISDILKNYCGGMLPTFSTQHLTFSLVMAQDWNLSCLKSLFCHFKSVYQISILGNNNRKQPGAFASQPRQCQPRGHFVPDTTCCFPGRHKCDRSLFVYSQQHPKLRKLIGYSKNEYIIVI